MSDGGNENDDKTEEPSQKRIDDAREKGDVPRSSELKHAGMFVAGWVVIGSLSLSTVSQLMPMMKNLLGSANQYAFNAKDTQMLGFDIAKNTSLALLLPFTVFMLAGLAGGLSQGRPTLSWSKVAPKWSKLNPVAGWKRLFGMASFIEFSKTLLKFAVITWLVSMIVWPHLARLETILNDDAVDLLVLIKGLVTKMFFVVAIFVMILAMADYTYQRFAFFKRMRMSKQELKDEYKQSEGDPHIKARIRGLRLSRARKRMMAAVPSADVIITNPTHFAVALRYEHGKQGAPRVVAKGVDSMAQRIRALATKHEIPLVESPPLARSLYASVDIDEEIQPEHYKAVAEIISAILKLRSKLPGRPLASKQLSSDRPQG